MAGARTALVTGVTGQDGALQGRLDNGYREVGVAPDRLAQSLAPPRSAHCPLYKFVAQVFAHFGLADD